MSKVKTTFWAILLTILMLAAVVLLGGTKAIVVSVDAAENAPYDLIKTSEPNNWSALYPNQGTWNVNQSLGNASLDAFNSAYGLEGAMRVSSAGMPLGAFEYSANIKITEFNAANKIAMVGIIPWYIDKNNYLSVQLKFSNIDKTDGTGDFIKSPAEIQQKVALEQVLVAGMLNGEDKYKDSTTKEANTSFRSFGAGSVLKDVKKDMLNADGHNIKVKFENLSASALCYKVSIYYNDTFIGATDIYYYIAKANPESMGFMGQDLKATFSNCIVSDFYAEHANRENLARDWMGNSDFVYRTFRGSDVYKFNANNSITVDAKSYKMTSGNFAGYDTHRGFTANPVAKDNGLPQNYEVKATFKADEIPGTYNSKSGLGLIPWYKDDLNYVDVLVRREVGGTSAKPVVKDKLVMYGYIAGSNIPVGTTTYDLPESFDITKENTIRVEKKSVEFLVYLNDGTEPVIRKKVLGAGENFYYGYAGYNNVFTAGKLESKAIYSAYDEISVYDSNNSVWKAASNAKTAWAFTSSNIALTAKEGSAALGKESYVYGESDIHSSNIKLELSATVALGATEQLSSLMIVPYALDDDNYVHIGLVWKNGKTYVRVRASVYTDEQREADLDAAEGKEVGATRRYKEMEIGAVSTNNAIAFSIEKIDNTVTLAIAGKVVYGIKINGINNQTPEIGIIAYNADLSLSTINTIGYKKYEKITVGDWMTSGISKGAWSIDSKGNLIGSNLYADSDAVVEEDEARIYAVKENPASLQQNYTISITTKRIDKSRAQDRIGVVCWYLDDSNYLIYMMDHWRADSAVPRTTFFGKVGGNFLPTRYTHGAWLPEGTEGGIFEGQTQTESSQTTNPHTITVKKEGNEFTCTIDNGHGLLKSVVDIPELTPSQKVYTGMYVLNDKVEYSEYGVYSNDTARAVTAPATKEQSTEGNSEKEPTLESYIVVDFTDEFRKLTTSGVEVTDPTDPPNPEQPENPEDPNKPGNDGGDSCGGCSGSGSAVGLILALPLLMLIKRKK